MKLCPKCKTEYEDSQKQCPLCHIDKKTQEYDYREDWVELTVASDDIEFSIIEGVLKMGNIPVIKEVRGDDRFFTVFAGVPVVGGIHVLVPKDRYEEAFKLLNAKYEEEDE